MQRDQLLFKLIKKEQERQENGIELIASENFASPQVIEAMGTVLTNKYAEGLPGKRYYGGCEIVDEIEQLAIDRAKGVVQRILGQCTTSFRSASKCGSNVSSAKSRR